MSLTDRNEQEDIQPAAQSGNCSFTVQSIGQVFITAKFWRIRYSCSVKCGVISDSTCWQLVWIFSRQVPFSVTLLSSSFTPLNTPSKELKLPDWSNLKLGELLSNTLMGVVAPPTMNDFDDFDTANGRHVLSVIDKHHIRHLTGMVEAHFDIRMQNTLEELWQPSLFIVTF